MNPGASSSPPASNRLVSVDAQRGGLLKTILTIDLSLFLLPLLVALSATLGFCQDASTHVIVSIHFSRGWDITVHKDGGAILGRGAFDHIRVPAGTFDFRLWEAECIRARDGSQKMGVSSKDHGFVVVSKDDDFTALSAMRGRPPCLIKLSVGKKKHALLRPR